MRGIINVKFEKIRRKKVDKELLKKFPKLFKSTEKTVEILCEQIKKYFKDNKIKVKTDFKLER